MFVNATFYHDKTFVWFPVLVFVPDEYKKQYPRCLTQGYLCKNVQCTTAIECGILWSFDNVNFESLAWFLVSVFFPAE